MCLVLWCQSLFAPSRINAVEKVWKLKLVKKKRYKQTALRRWHMAILWPVVSKRLHKVSIGSCCALAAKTHSAFDERNFCFYCIQPWVFVLSSNVNVRAKAHFAIFHVLLFLRSTFCFQFLCSEYKTKELIVVQYLELFASQIYRYIGFITGNSLSLAY